MAAALGEMVAGVAKLSHYDFAADRAFLAEAVRRDAAAYDAVVAAYRRPKEERGPFVQEALRQATLVPLEVAERAAAVRARLEALLKEAPAKVSSDVETGIALATAAVTGSLANVRVNLGSIRDEEFRRAVEARAQEVS